MKRLAHLLLLALLSAMPGAGLARAASLDRWTRPLPRLDDAPHEPCRGGTRVFEAVSVSGARRIRTADLLGAIQALCQLSYSPETWLGS
jgi:hypothetical protein